MVKYCNNDLMEPMFSELISLGIYIIFGVMTTYFCIHACIQINIINKKTPFTKGLYYSQMIFFITALGYFIFRVPVNILNCFVSDRRIYLLFWLVMIVLFGLHYLTLILTLFYRLESVFSNTILQLSNKSKVLFYLNFGFLIVFGFTTVGLILANIYILIFYLLAFGIILLNLTVLAQILAWTFVSKLGKLNRNNKAVSTEMELKFMDTITKYAILSVTSVMFTTFVLLSIIYSALKSEWSYIDGVLQAIGAVLDVFIDTLCMYLSLSVNNRMYYYICWFCDIKCKLLCVKNYSNNKETRDTIKEMARQSTRLSVNTITSMGLNQTKSTGTSQIQRIPSQSPRCPSDNEH